MISQPDDRHSGSVLLLVARELALGFCYWLIFLLALEPDNVLRAIQGGGGLAWRQELLRISVASLLGALPTPLLIRLVRRFPIEGTAWLRHALFHLIAIVTAATLLITVSCLLADWFLASEQRPLRQALVEEFIANWPLLVVCLMGFAAVAHAIRFVTLLREGESQRAGNPQAAPYLTQVPIKTRGQTKFLDLGLVDWIETQGNYLAFHVGSNTHLLRESLMKLECQLDPKRFVRVHRRLIVPVCRVQDMTALGAGDALLRLQDGTKVRVSRNYRAALETVLHRNSGSAGP